MDEARLAERILQCLLYQVQKWGEHEGARPEVVMDQVRIWPSRLWGGSRYLVNRGWIRERNDEDFLTLTSSGKVEALRLQEIWNNRSLRIYHLHQALLNWVQYHRTVRLEDFESDDARWFCGQEFRSFEVRESVEFLASRGLVSVEVLWCATKVEITPNGRNFAISGQNLADRMQDESRTMHVTNNYDRSNFAYSGAHVGAMTTGDNATLNIQNGIPADRLAALIRQLHEITPHLNLDEDAQEEYRQQVDSLSEGAAEPERAHRWFHGLTARFLTPAIEAGADQAVAATVGAGFSLLGLPS